MKKAVVIALVAALALSMLAFMAGCGGDANKDEAKEYMKAGDAYMSDVLQQTSELETMQTDLATTALEGDMSAITGEAGTALQEEVAGILSSIGESLKLAKAEYENILTLDGVDTYKEYATKMMEAIDVYLEQLDYTTQLVGMLSDALAAIAQGQDVDIISLMMDSEELQKVDELGKKGDDLVDEANQIKLDNNLEG